MFCHIACKVVHPDGKPSVDVRATLPCDKPLGVGTVQGLLTALYPDALQFDGLKIHNDDEGSK